jgi:hypothetical protein
VSHWVDFAVGSGCEGQRTAPIDHALFEPAPANTHTPVFCCLLTPLSSHPPASSHPRPEHYSALPTFWPEVIDAACKTVIEQGNMDGASQTTAEGTNVAPAEAAAATTGNRKLMRL